MAQDYAPLLRSIWSDEDFRGLTLDAQWLYMALLSSPDRNDAGVLVLTPRRWARLSIDMDVARTRAALQELDAAGFVVLDEDTEEVLVRAYVRRTQVFRHIRLLMRAMREVAEVESPRLRSALGQELSRLPKLAVPERSESMASEAREAQRRLDELVSIMCDSPPDPPGVSAGQELAHGMSHGMADGIAHPHGVGAGAGAGVGAGSARGPADDERDQLVVELPRTRGSELASIARCFAHPGQLRRTCRSCEADRKAGAAS